MADAAEMLAKLKLLGDAYAAQLPEKLRQLESCWTTWREHNRAAPAKWDATGFNAMYRMVHGLSGSGRTFGFPGLSQAASDLEVYLNQIAQEQKPLDDAQAGRVDALLAGLKQTATKRDMHSVSRLLPVQSQAAAAEHKVARHVVIVEDDQELAADLKVQLNYFGYAVSVFHQLEDFRRLALQSPEAVILMDINFPGDELGGIRVMTELQQGRKTKLPVIFLSSYNEMGIRLGAVRAGGVAYLSKPVNVSQLVDVLDGLALAQRPVAYRVMVIDDDRELAAYYAAALEHAGMLARVESDPLDVMHPLTEFAPDLILVDLYMPECNGMELAGAIRQIDAFVSIPIVFLSAETDLDKQLSALDIGVDDFLTKPIRLPHLIAAVTSRIKRSQILRSFMVRDSLTGLLNHTAIKEQLSHEVARAKRQGKPMAFAMVDIDQFKTVNDRFGHPVGDQVIKSLSRLLKQRLRENDLVGRYGGEEFAVILVDTDATAAMKIMDAIRKDFKQLRYMAEEQVFSSSFSCGIADNADHETASRLIDAADKALYKAKQAGRNQVALDHSG